MLQTLDWRPLKQDRALALLEPIRGDGGASRLQVTGQTAGLPFYKDARFVWLKVTSPQAITPIDVLFLTIGSRPRLLEGKAQVIHDANEAEHLALTAETVAAYAWFFCSFVYSDQGPFIIVTAANKPGGPEDLKLEPNHPDGRFRLDARVRYGDTLFRATFAVAPDGQIEMVDDEPLDELIDPEPPAFPLIRSAAEYRKVFAPPAGLTRSAEPAPDVFVTLLIEQALAAQSGHRLLARFNVTAAQLSPVGQFAELLATASPVVVIESPMPFVEETVAAIVTAVRAGKPALTIVRSEPEGGDDTRLRVKVPMLENSVVLLAMHAYRSIVDAARVAYELDGRRVAALIGCERLSDLPANLRDIVDITLTLPPVSEDVFEKLFQRVLGVPLPDGWRGTDTRWVTFVLPGDFEHPANLQLTPADALEFVRGRVVDRMHSVEVAGALGVKDLQGLGEARLFAEDLIADIHQAVIGAIAWSEVDRGVLLAGAPGTGKTTLARAIAKDCGIKFISASAASWQAAGYLADHIRAIRADFSLARRFAPSILFIDEIDSIGNREMLSGQNMQYQMEVVNAVLEQIQGLDPRCPVIVIGATNHPDRVDPALRRAGRLDRTISIPFPNSAALAAIFDHYLKPLAKDGKLGADVDTKALGQMCLRRTGADVEFFVRGAQRRARKAGRSVMQADLLAEVTGRAREASALPPMSADEIETTAFHEAGHALAQCLSRSKGEDITFSSIVPRADGTLGFVMMAPSDKQSLTRADYHALLEVALAGRAAEEIRFGADGITSGASTDLQKATSVAVNMIVTFGLGPGNSLLSSRDVSPAQLSAADALLSNIYAGVRAKLEARRGTLNALAAALKAKEELTGAEIRAIVAASAS